MAEVCECVSGVDEIVIYVYDGAVGERGFVCFGKVYTILNVVEELII